MGQDSVQSVGQIWMQINSSSIPRCLKVHINYFAILINSPPQVMLLAIYLYEYFINVEGISVTTVLALQSAGINCSEFDASESDRLPTHCDATLGE